MKRIILESRELEEKVINSAYRNFKKEIKKPSVVTEENQVINEGIKFFKASPRLYRLALKIEKKSARNPELGLQDVVRKINALANKFELAEDLYDVGKKAEAKVMYKKLNKDYSDILKLLRKDTIKENLKKIGAIGFTIAGMTVPYLAMSHFFPNLAIGAVNSEAAAMNGWQKTGLYLKRAGAFTLCGLPVKIARNGAQAITDQMETKSLARIDKLLGDSSIDYSEYKEEELHQI